MTFLNSLSSLILIKALDKIATIPPAVIPEDSRPAIDIGRQVKISGTISTDRPKEKLKAITNTAMRFSF